jgi:RNA polymerase sigma-70 factor (ECF subfamily)
VIGDGRGRSAAVTEEGGTTPWPVAPPVARAPTAPLTRGTDPPEPARPGPDARTRRRPPAEPGTEAERALIERAQAGDRDAFRLLYEANVTTVVSFLARRVGPQVAEDLAAETFTKAFERLDRFEWRGVPLRAWLLRIAYHEVVARSRRRSSTEVTTDDPWPEPSAGHEDAIVDHLALSGSLAAALSSLGAQQRLAVELRYLRGLSVAEASQVLGIGEEAVRALTYRSLTSLRAALS